MGFVDGTCEAVERRTICNSETTTTIFLLPPLGCLSAHKIAAKCSTFISNGFRESLLLNFDFLPFCFRSLDAVRFSILSPFHRKIGALHFAGFGSNEPFCRNWRRKSAREVVDGGIVIVTPTAPRTLITVNCSHRVLLPRSAQFICEGMKNLVVYLL